MISRNVRRAAVFTVHYLDCNPLRYRPESCYCPVDTWTTYVLNRLRYRAVARPYAVIHVDPRAIRWNLRVPPRRWALGTILDGNWDRALRRPVDIAWKIVSMQQRFNAGYPWKETDLFRRFYLPQFENDPDARVKGTLSIEELAAEYERDYDALYAVIRDRGFATPSLRDPGVTFAYVHIDRNGDLMYTLEGNHRLGMAVALELPTIPVRVATRHGTWQRVREAVHRGEPVPDRHRDHPDLADIAADRR